MNKYLAAGTMIIAAVSTANAQEQVGRYQAFVATPPNAIYSKIIIIDTATGDLWEYLQQGAVSTSNAGSYLQYITRVRPGKKNEYLDFQGFGQPKAKSN